MATDTSPKLGKLVAVVATMLTKEFQRYFARGQDNSVVFFESGAEALNTWREHRTPYFFCDHSGLSDGMTSFRLIKQLRSDEETKGVTAVYVMSENPQAHERNLAASHFGATGIILRSPQSVGETIGGFSRPSVGVAAPAQSDDKAQLEALFRKFVGPVASQLLASVHQDLGANVQMMSFRDFANLLAQRIRSENMRNAFWDAVRALKK